MYASQNTPAQDRIRRPSRLWTMFVGNPPGVIGAAMLLTLALLAICAPWIAPFDPLAQVSMSFEPISPKHWLGTDELGRDILSRVLFGFRLSLIAAFGTAVLAAVLGVAIGLVAGYFGGWLDAATMRVLDVILSVPAILLAIVLVAIMGGGLIPLIVAIAIVAVPAFARLTRASVLTVKEREYVTAQRAAGAPPLDIILRTVLPNVLGPAVVQIVITASTAVLTESGLNFLGLGVPPPSPSLGSMLAAGNENLFVSPAYPIIVGLAIGILVAAFDTFGAGLQRAYGASAGRSGVVA